MLIHLKRNVRTNVKIAQTSMTGIEKITEQTNKMSENWH